MTKRVSVASHRPAPLLVTVAEAAELLGIGRSKFYELIGAGAIRTVLIGRARRVPVAALDELVDALVALGEKAPHLAGTLR